MDIIKFSLYLEARILNNLRIRRTYRLYNARHRCPLFVDIVQVNWSLGRCWRSSPGSDSTMSHIMLTLHSLPSLHLLSTFSSSRFSLLQIQLLIKLAGAKRAIRNATAVSSSLLFSSLLFFFAFHMPCIFFVTIIRREWCFKATQ